MIFPCFPYDCCTHHWDPGSSIQPKRAHTPSDAVAPARATLHTVGSFGCWRSLRVRGHVSSCPSSQKGSKGQTCASTIVLIHAGKSCLGKGLRIWCVLALPIPPPPSPDLPSPHSTLPCPVQPPALPLIPIVDLLALSFCHWNTWALSCCKEFYSSFVAACTNRICILLAQAPQ